MVFWLIPIIALAIIGPIVANLIRRPVDSALEGTVLTEHPPVRTAMMMYVNGSVSEEYFIATMKRANITPEDQQTYLTYARDKINKLIGDRNAAHLREIQTHLNRINSNYDRLDADADDIEFDEFAKAVKNSADELDVDRHVIELQLATAVKKGHEGPLVDAIKTINAGAAALNATVFEKRREILARKKERADKEYEELRKIQESLPSAPQLPPLAPTPTPFTAAEINRIVLLFGKMIRKAATADDILELKAFSERDPDQFDKLARFAGLTIEIFNEELARLKAAGEAVRSSAPPQPPAVAPAPAPVTPPIPQGKTISVGGKNYQVFSQQDVVGAWIDYLKNAGAQITNTIGNRIEVILKGSSDTFFAPQLF